MAAWTGAAAKNTLRALRADLRIVDAFQREAGRPTLPLAPGDLYTLIDARARGGSAKASIGRLVATMVRVHSLAALAPCVDDLVRWKLKQTRKIDARATRQARGLRLKGATADVVDGASVHPSLLGLLGSIPDDPRGLRDRALILVGYDAGLRRSELVRVTVEHIEYLPNGEAALFIPRSKTDQGGEGARAWLSVRAVVACREWLDRADIVAGPIFRSLLYRVGADGMLDGGTVARILKDRLRGYLDAVVETGELTGADRDAIVAASSGHSLRVGCNQDLFAAGVDIGAIMQGLRWSTPRQPLAYARHLAPATSKLAAVMRRVRVSEPS